MTRRFLSVAIALASLGAPAILATSASAQTPAPAAPEPAPPVASPVVVYSLQGVLGATAAGRDMATKLQAIETTIMGELEAERVAIVAERDRLAQTPAGQMQSPEFRRAEAAFQQRVQGFEVMRRRAEVDMQATQERSVGLFMQALSPVMTAVVTQRNALVVTEASNVAYAVAGVNITGDLVRGLDAATQTINVQRVRVQTEEEAAAAAAAPAAGTPAAAPAPAAGNAPLPRRPTPVPRGN